MTTIDIRNVIVHEGMEINVGRTILNPRVMGACDDIMIIDNETDMYNVKQIGRYPCAAESFMYLYQIYNHEDYELHYYVVGDKPLHENGKYFTKIGFDTKLKTNDLKTAFIEFAEYCEPLSF